MSDFHNVEPCIIVTKDLANLGWQSLKVCGDVGTITQDQDLDTMSALPLEGLTKPQRATCHTSHIITSHLPELSHKAVFHRQS